MTSEERQQMARQRPIGKVIRKNADGTVDIELDMTHPDACEMVGSYLIGGRESANETLKRQQARDSN